MTLMNILRVSAEKKGATAPFLLISVLVVRAMAVFTRDGGARFSDRRKEAPERFAKAGTASSPAALPQSDG